MVDASGADVDAGFALNDWRVGQAGEVVALQLYIGAAFAISGSAQ